MENTSSDSCPQLNGLANFQMWKVRVAARLRRNKVYGHVTGTTRKDTSTPPKDGDSWEVMDEKAHGIIIDTLDDNTALQVADLTTSKQVYDRIIKIYEGTNTNSTAFYTWVEMMDLKWDGISPISDHIASVRAGERRLAALGRQIDSAFLAYFLLHSLPSDSTWSSFTASVLNSLPSNSDVSFTDIETRLLAEATRVVSSTGKAESALKAAKPRPKPKHCERHGKCAHSTEECNTLKAERTAKKASKGKAKAHHAETATDESSEDSTSEDIAHANHVVTKKLMKRISAYAAVPSNLKKNDFILDSGCSRHMFPHRGYFVPGTFKPHKQQVSFGDESTAEAIGYGDVCVRSNIKGSIMEITLSDCLYIPSFAVSLMSAIVSVEKAWRSHLSDTPALSACTSRRSIKASTAVAYITLTSSR